MVLMLAGCNYNEYVPEVERVVRGPEDLPVIASSGITTVFGQNTRQTLRLVTTESLDNQGDLYFYASHDLEASQPTIENVVVVVHGLAASEAELQAEYNAIRNAVNAAGGSGSTLVIAPYFNHEGSGALLDWNNAVWRAGGRATSPAGAQLGSTQIVDYLLQGYVLEAVAFANVSSVIIAGHSAGGQFVQRHAAISRLEPDFPNVQFSYVTANPSHYLYPNPRRWNGTGTFIPATCPTYDDYPYGLSALTQDIRYAFVSKIGLETIRANYIFRDVHYVLGDQDVTDATTDCESLQQQGGAGESRYVRGQYMKQFMDNQYPSNNHQLVTVAGVGHSPSAMYASPEFEQLLEQLLQ